MEKVEPNYLQLRYHNFVAIWSDRHLIFIFLVLQDQAAEVILTLGQAFEVAYQMALKEYSSSCNGLFKSHSTSSSTNFMKKNVHNHLVSNNADASVSTTPSKTTTSINFSQYFMTNKDGRVPLLTHLAEAKFHEVKRRLDIEGASDVKMFKKLILSVGNSDFRLCNRIEKKVADEIFALAINELNIRSENTTQLAKYYSSSYPAEMSVATKSVSIPGVNGLLKKTEVNDQTSTTSLNQYFTRDVDSRIPLWVMMVEERYEDIRRVLLAASSLNEVETLRLVASNMADKVFREKHGITREVADEVFECAADELMAREGTMAQLLDHYNKSYNWKICYS